MPYMKQRADSMFKMLSAMNLMEKVNFSASFDKLFFDTAGDPMPEHEKFVEAGISYELASINGGKPPIDGESLDFNDQINKKFWNDADFQEKLANTLKIGDSSDFDAIFFAGGH